MRLFRKKQQSPPTPDARSGSGLAYVLGDEFQTEAANNAVKWDKEWMRYLSAQKHYYFYFYDMSSDRYALSSSPETIAGWDPGEVYRTKLYKNISCQVWVPGDQLVGKSVLEIGCGPGMLGRMVGRFAERYVGLDMSRFALSIARLTNPVSSSFHHLSDVAGLRALERSIDTCVGRHFFIHHNYEDSLWLLALIRDLTKPGGVISADFFCNESRLEDDRVHRAAEPLNPDHPSALYHFTEADIRRMADDLGLECESIDVEPELDSAFATYRVR